MDDVTRHIEGATISRDGVTIKVTPRFRLPSLAAMVAAIGPMYAGDTIKPKRYQYSTASKYGPCPCGSGKKFKFCCFR